MSNLKVFGALMLHCFFALCGPQSQGVVCANNASPKGVVLIVIDDIGYGDIDVLSPSELETPRLDKLCGESIRLTDFHVGTTCSPSRASILTGRSINAGGVWHTIAGREILRANEQTMAEMFHANGWATGIFGKWHLGDGFPYSPRFRGFDVAVVHGGGGIGQGPDYWCNDYYSGVDFKGEATSADVYSENGKPIEADKFCTDFWFERAAEFIGECVSKEVPFFCYIPTNAAHGPFNAPNGFKKGFDGLIENVDFNVGQLDDYLDNIGIKDDVLLVFTTDNGTAGPRNGGLRGKKGSHFDGGHNVPCFWRWKNGGLAGSQDSARDIPFLTAGMDLMPSFIDMFRLERPSGGRALHGVSLKDMLVNPEFMPSDRTIVVDTQRTKDLVKWKKACVMRDEVANGRLQHKWRMIRDSADAPPMLFDFQLDRNTDDDIVESNETVVESLTTSYESWWTQIAKGQEPYPPYVVDSRHEPELTLYAHSWIGGNSTPWHQKHVRNGNAGTGTHAIRFAEKGDYRIELRRWPREDGGTIVGTCNNGKGEAIAAVEARLTIENVGKVSKVIPDGAASVVFEMKVDNLETTTINTAFIDQAGKRISGAYYVYLKKLATSEQ